MYAGRKRRKPVQRTAKPPSTEVVKSNPSKRHRDRLNSELERLASLLPFAEDVTSSLDKLSILRLSVSYLRAKNFFSVALKNHTCSSNGVSANMGSHGNGKAARLADGLLLEGELLLQALNGFVLVITADGTVFYTSHTILDYLGFHQTDVMHQSVFEMVHTEDQQELRRNLHWALNPPAVAYPSTQESPNDSDGSVRLSAVAPCHPEHLPPENSSFLERSFVCRFRCLLDNSSGFLALNLQGRLKFLHGQSQQGQNGVKAPPELALFAIATPLQSPSILEIRTKNMIFRTKHKLDFSPLACDAKGKIVLGYTEAELRVRGSGYQFIHAADMLLCAENHVRMMKTGESGLTVFRLLTKDNRWKWVQANARIVYKNGRPDYIIATQRPLLEEEGGEHLRKRSLHLPFTFTTGEALLYHSSHPIPGFSDSLQGNALGEANGKARRGRTEKEPKDVLDPGSLLGAMMSQDESVYISQPAPDTKVSLPSHLFGELRGPSRLVDSIDAVTHGSAAFEHWQELVDGTSSSVPGLPENGRSFDPLLATLDSLTLESEGPAPGFGSGDEGKDTCSNGELFNALEGLGLTAEDLELLLLDERMIRVEMDPEHVPSLDDLLTSDEILNYIHDSLEQHRDELVDITSQPHPASAQTTTATQVTAAGPCAVAHSSAVNPPPPPPHAASRPPVSQPPLVSLSQQMKQHLSLKQPQAPSPNVWDQQGSYVDTAEGKDLQLVLERHPTTNGFCPTQHLLAGMSNSSAPQDQQTLLANHELPQLLPAGGSSNGGSGHTLHYLQFPLQPQQNHQQQQQHPHHQQQHHQQQRQHLQHHQHQQLLHNTFPQPHPQCHAIYKTVSGQQPAPFKGDQFATKDHWPDYVQNGHGGTHSLPCHFNGPTPSTCASTNSYMNYSMVDVPITAGVTAATVHGNGIHPSAMNSISAYQMVNGKSQEQLAQVLSSISNQIQPCRQLASLESRGLFTSELTQSSAQHKIQNGCLPSAAHMGENAVSSGNGLPVPSGITPLPETLPSFTDHQTTGFFF